jgi:hypothetical protein
MCRTWGVLMVEQDRKEELLGRVGGISLVFKSFFLCNIYKQDNVCNLNRVYKTNNGTNQIRRTN